MSITTTKGITVAGWCLLGAVAVTVVASFLPWYSITILGLTATANAWNSFWWLPIVVAIGVAVVYLLGALSGTRMPRLALPIAALVSFVLTLIILIDILVEGTDAVQLGDSGPLGGGDTLASSGPSFGLFLALIATGAMTYFAAVAARESGANLSLRFRR
ncbi:MAG: hypothetical protein LLG14_08695 [Nocardiaceae bacterium]|nr:hypothetical protein [Nocardiaceae bacterium]